MQVVLRDGVARVTTGAGAGASDARARSVQLTWSPDEVRVVLDGEQVKGGTCQVAAGAALKVAALSSPARTEYLVDISRNRMQATLRIEQTAGVERRLLDADSAGADQLRIRIEQEPVEPSAPNAAEALAAVQHAGVVHGLEPEALQTAIAAPLRSETLIATGTEPVEGRNGFLEPLIDFDAIRGSGVVAGVPLLRRVRMREGTPGRDVNGRELSSTLVREARLKPGQGVSLDEAGILALADVDGSPQLREDGLLEVLHELIVDQVDTSTGDIDFTGTVIVRGDVG
ncbi:MAG: flagellar assembly protein A, partial [Gaiellales bacterium]